MTHCRRAQSVQCSAVPRTETFSTRRRPASASATPATPATPGPATANATGKGQPAGGGVTDGGLRFRGRRVARRRMGGVWRRLDSTPPRRWLPVANRAGAGRASYAGGAPECARVAGRASQSSPPLPVARDKYALRHAVRGPALRRTTVAPARRDNSPGLRGNLVATSIQGNTLQLRGLLRFLENSAPRSLQLCALCKLWFCYA